MPETREWNYQETMGFLARTYGGYTNPWRSRVDPRNGEAAYTALVEEHLGPELAVVEAGCGHGVDALAWAPKAARLIAFDYAPEMIEIARAAAARRPCATLAFVVADSNADRGGGIPAEDASVDLIVSRRGPTSVITDARRVLKPGGAIIQVAYMATPVAAWNAALPEELRMREEPATVPGLILDRLAAAGLPLHSSWTFDVPELFDEPEQLYNRLAWDRKRPGIAPFAVHRAAFERLFEEHARDGGLTLRQRRFLWKAVA